MAKKTRKIILDLCGGTGSWSKPYRENRSYDVRIIDPQEWGGKKGTGDVRMYELPDLKKEPIYGVLAAPPCTHLSGSGARWWADKGDAKLLEGLAVADACLRVCVRARPVFWALENPVGRLRKYFGDPTYLFNPCDHGDPYTKKTLLWGDFNIPEQDKVEPTEGSKTHLMTPGPERARLRSTTPPGFARAFFNANR